MKAKSRDEVYWGQPEQEEMESQVESSEAPKKQPQWFEKIPTEGIPYVKRPDGKGVRVDFFGFSNLMGIAMEIKEAMPHRFKHSGDVHRNAHYVGMYILREIYVKEKSNHEADKIITASNKGLNKASEREIIRGRLRHFYEHFASGVLTEEDFNDDVKTMYEAISSDETKTWFIEDVRKMLNDTHEFKKPLNSNRMRDLKVLENIKLIPNGGNCKNNDEEN